MKISVYQESINKEFDEYLVNFKYLTKLMQDYGFTIAENLSLPSSGTFESLYENMMKDENKLYHIAKQMSEEEKEISFLNKYFIFKKTQEILYLFSWCSWPSPRYRKFINTCRVT